MDIISKRETYSPDALLERAGLDPAELVNDPLTIAIEGACYVLKSTAGIPKEVIGQAAEVLPPNSTEFMRGLAGGIAFMMAIQGQ